MRVTFVLAHADLSGGVRVVAMYADSLRRQGHEVLVVSRPPRPLSFRERLRALVQGKRASVGAVSSHVDALDVPHRVLRDFRPVEADDVPDADVIVATWWATANWIASFPARKGQKVYFAQGYEKSSDDDDVRCDAAWRHPMHRIAVSQWLVDVAAERFGVHDVALVPNGVDLDVFRAPERGKQAAPTVGFVYSTSPLKSVDVAIRAIERARTRIPGLRAVAFGATPPSGALPLPPKTAYTLRPAQQALRGIYASCDAWLWSSRQEGYGLPLLESMACRTPVIATCAGAAPELLANGGGYLIQRGDADAMADAIERLCGLSDDAWRAMSAAAYATACARDWRTSARLFESELTRIVACSATVPANDRAQQP